MKPRGPSLGLIIGLSVGITIAAELGYFVIWAVLLFPEGEIASKAVWTATRGIAMGDRPPLIGPV